MISLINQRAQANEELQQKILKEGQEAVQIDSHLNEPEVPTQVPSDSKMITEDNESSNEEDNDNADNNDITEEPQTQKIVELNFALGDFDDTNIALLEELGKEEDNNDEDEPDNDEDS